MTRAGFFSGERFKKHEIDHQFGGHFRIFYCVGGHLNGHFFVFFKRSPLKNPPQEAGFKQTLRDKNCNAGNFTTTSKAHNDKILTKFSRYLRFMSLSIMINDAESTFLRNCDNPRASL